MSGSAALLDVDGVDEWRGVYVEIDEEVGDAEDENKKTSEALSYIPASLRSAASNKGKQVKP